MSGDQGGAACSSEYGPIEPGLGVRLTSDRRLVGFAVLVRDDEADPASCAFTFVMPGVEHRDGEYSLSVADRDAGTFDVHQLRAGLSLAG
ncbi:hypothetical protein [Rhodococcus gannanensis]|uniref:Uncharacterized protein n=1 Tax=Rhodococcus gannanensis TaxID=1960308 RepID=A0ABW4NXD7_9NOCA